MSCRFWSTHHRFSGASPTLPRPGTAMSPAARAVASASLIARQPSGIQRLSCASLGMLAAAVRCCCCDGIPRYSQVVSGSCWSMLLYMSLRTGWFDAKLLFSGWIPGMWSFFLNVQVSSAKFLCTASRSAHLNDHFKWKPLRHTVVGCLLSWQYIFWYSYASKTHFQHLVDVAVYRTATAGPFFNAAERISKLC